MNDVQVVEKILKKAEKPMLKSEILHQIENLDFKGINTILDKLEGKGRIVVGGKGVLWTENSSRKFNELITNGAVHDA